MKRIRLTVLLAIPLVVAGWVAACSSDDDNPGTLTTNSSTGGASQGGSGTGGLNLGGSTAQQCTTSADCDGGVCINGICCDSAENACGNDCCGGDEVCVFDSCVTPGDACLTEADCPDDHYCEPALGDDTDAGPIDAGPDAVCTAPTPANGRCVPLPPVCGPDGGTSGCIEPCEYHPPVGQLNSVVKWQWCYDPAPTEYPNRA
ncbi:MAG: hypothetical protein JRI23_25475, partial [Deltaproteobacteria bacterium]|nr:hypothetical protein [Deltaproteobacteria bacterium]MBW2535373.1 hypothetical protein [Deltaproteobacteria bacterium]